MSRSQIAVVGGAGLVAAALIGVMAASPGVPCEQGAFCSLKGVGLGNAGCIEWADGGICSPGALASAGGWQTVFDCQFSALPFESLDGGSGPYTICGVPWTVVNSANLAFPIEVDGGLTIQPSGGVGGPPNTAPGIATPLESIYPALSNATGLRITWYEADNVASLASDFMFCQLNVADLPSMSNGATMTQTLMAHAFNSSVGWAVSVYWDNNQLTNTNVQTPANYASSHIMQLVMPTGTLPGGPYSLWGNVDGGTTTWVGSTANPFASQTGALSGSALFSAISPLSKWDLMLTGALNSGSGALLCDTARVTVEVRQ